MADHFNGLSPAELERLAMLAEECGEVIQIVNKIIRHGYDLCHPARLHIDNRSMLAHELADLYAVARRMVHEKDISGGWQLGAAEAKAWERKLQYAHHQQGVEPHKVEE